MIRCSDPLWLPLTKGENEDTLMAEKKGDYIMKQQRVIELAVKVIVAALTAFLTAIGTTSCMGQGPIWF